MAFYHAIYIATVEQREQQKCKIMWFSLPKCLYGKGNIAKKWFNIFFLRTHTSTKSKLLAYGWDNRSCYMTS